MVRPKKQHLKLRPDGRYVCRYKGRFFYGTAEDEAFQAREDYKIQEALGQTINQRLLTEFARKWLPIVKASVQDNTYGQYAVLIEKLVQYLGNKEMDDIIYRIPEYLASHKKTKNDFCVAIFLL